MGDVCAGVWGMRGCVHTEPETCAHTVHTMHTLFQLPSSKPACFAHTNALAHKCTLRTYCNAYTHKAQVCRGIHTWIHTETHSQKWMLHLPSQRGYRFTLASGLWELWALCAPDTPLSHTRPCLGGLRTGSWLPELDTAQPTQAQPVAHQLTLVLFQAQPEADQCAPSTLHVTFSFMISFIFSRVFAFFPPKTFCKNFSIAQSCSWLCSVRYFLQLFLVTLNLKLAHTKRHQA